jgi:hypothetical protein
MKTPYFALGAVVASLASLTLVVETASAFAGQDGIQVRREYKPSPHGYRPSPHGYGTSPHTLPRVGRPGARNCFKVGTGNGARLVCR